MTDRSRRPRLALAATAAAGLLVPLLTPAAAHAEGARATDGTDDVWTYQADSGTYAPASQTANVDVTKVQVRHDERTISYRLTFDKLTKNGTGYTFATAFLQVPNGDRYRLATVIGPGQRTVKSARTGIYSAEDGTKVACAGRKPVIDYDADVVGMVVPRGCLDRPRTVAWAARGELHFDDGDGGTIIYSDDAASDQGTPATFQPRLSRG